MVGCEPEVLLLPAQSMQAGTRLLEQGKQFREGQILVHRLWASEASAVGRGKGLEGPGYTCLLPFLGVLLSPKGCPGRGWGASLPLQRKGWSVPRKGKGGDFSPSLCW